MFKKALKLDKRLTIVYAREKKVDKDAICPIIVMSYYQRTYCRTYFTPPMQQFSEFGRSD